MGAETTNERAAHFCQLEEADCFLKQAFVLGLKSHFTDDSSGVPGKLIYNSRLDEKRRRSE